MPVKWLRNICYWLVLLLAGCQLTPYQRPDLAIPDAWQQMPLAPPALTAPTSRASWWQQFSDATLVALIRQGRERNPDLQIAMIKLRQAQTVLESVQGWARLESKGSVMASAQHQAGTDGVQSAHAGELKTAYELDLWGHVAAGQRSRQALLSAARYDQLSAAILSDAALARLYWDIAAYKAIEVLLETELGNAGRLAALFQAQWQLGATTQSNTLSMQQKILAMQSELQALWQQRRVLENALVLLLDDPGSHRLPDIRPLPLAPVMPDLAAGLPSSLLARRPDLQAAEARLRARLAEVDQAQLAFLPQFNLIAQGQAVSAELVDLLKNPILTLGASISLPFLQWPQQQLKLKISQSVYELEAIDFRSRLYQAFREVNDALNARYHLAQQARLLKQQLTLARAHEKRAWSRYQAGEEDLQSWLELSNSRLSQEAELIWLNRNQLKNRADLYKALGGPPLQATPG